MSKWSLRRLIAICMGSIVAVCLVSVGASFLATRSVNRALDQFNERALSPHALVVNLGKAYVDEETGQRGFMLTGDEDFLQPYVAGRAMADRLAAELAGSLAGDAEASRRLDAVLAAAHDWSANAAEPQIAARRAGPIPQQELSQMTLYGKQLFDRLREQRSVLQARTSELINGQFDEVRARQRLADLIQYAMALMLVAGVVFCDWLLRRMLTRPVAGLVRDVNDVSQGHYDRAVSAGGLREVAVLASAADAMRSRLRQLVLDNEQASRGRADDEVRYRILADNAVDVLARLRGCQVVWISQSAETAFGWTVESWTGCEVNSRIHQEDLDSAANMLREVSSGASAFARVRVATADGAYHWVEARARPFIDVEGLADGIMLSARVVDEHVQLEQQLQADRNRFEAVAANTPSAISVRDLGYHYSIVNDAFCRLFGKESPADVIGRTEEEILPPDVLHRSRLASDRLLAGDSLVEEEQIDVGQGPVWVMTQRFPLRDPNGAICEVVAIRTDITHRKQIEQQIAERSAWEERIAAAIADGRLLVYSQPIVDIATGKAVEEELLVRLRDPVTQQILSPGDFLPQCELHGLMPVVDRYMVGAAIRLACAGRRVCVNITGQTIGSATAMAEILRALADAGPSVTDRISFEITETTAFSSPETAEAFSRGMSEVGCRLALDDFGTGYGAFTELRHLELAVLKIDLSFVRNMVEEPDDQRVVETIVFVARQYGLTTVAEGVESAELLDRLGRLGVDRAQGYFFGMPQPVAA